MTSGFVKWQRFCLLESDKLSILLHNADYIAGKFRNSNRNSVVETLRNFRPKENLQAELCKALANTPLQDLKIKRTLGMGGYGVAFELENGHVFKIGIENIDSGANSYKTTGTEIKDINHSGLANKNLPNVYESGDFSRDTLFSGFHYIEMVKYQTLQNHLQRLGVDILDAETVSEVFGIIMLSFAMFLKNKLVENENLFKKIDSKKIIEFYRNKVKNNLGNDGKILDENNLWSEVDKMLLAAYQIVVINRNNTDLHDENVGIDQSGNYVFFDY